MISVGRRSQDARAEFSLRMGIASRFWRRTAENLATASGYEGCTLIPLYHLADAPAGLTQVELSRRMMISESSVARILRPLLERKLISRTRMVGDSRARLIKVEAAGFMAMEAFEPRAAALRELLFEGLSNEEIERASRLLLVLTERLVRYSEPNDHT